MSKTLITSSKRVVADRGSVPKSLPEIMATYERVLIIQALERNGWSRTKTAESLGIRRNTLYKRIALLKIQMKELPRGRQGRPSTKGQQP
jgi:DNA-binding NtrC family response regulator